MLDPDTRQDPLSADPTTHPPLEPVPGIARYLGLTLLTAFGSLVAFEWTKACLLPNLTMWQSHAITIAVVTLMAGIASLFVRRKLQRLHAQVLTVRQQAAETVRAREANFRNLIEGSLQGILIHRESTALFVNQTYARIFGYDSPDEIRQLDSLAPLIAPHERERLLRYRDDRLAGKTVPAHYEYQGVRKDGSQVWLDMIVRVVNWEGQRATETVVVDITERKHVEASLRETEARFRSLVDGSIQGLSVIHPDGTRLFANRSYAAIYGYESPEGLLGLPVADQIAPHDRDRLRRNSLLRYQGKDAPARYVYQGIHRDERLIWLEVMASIIEWDGHPAQLITMMDITERKRLEDQLRQSQKMEAIGTLAGGIAHEFNNALSAILGYADLTQQDVEPGSRAWSNLQEVLKAGHCSKDLVQQILAFSHPSESEAERVDVALVIQDALKLLRPTLPTTIEIRQQVAPETGRVLANVGQLHQVLMNLCGNAEYAMRETGGMLAISAEPVEVDAALAAVHPALQPGPHVRVTVRDTGGGMPPEVVERVFEPFYTTKGVGEGTGMGLAIVHGIVMSHGGAITVESMLGQGTVFTFYLPAMAPDPEVVVDLPEPVLPRGTGRLLLVDDEEALAQLGKQLLERQGYEVVAYTSSVSALEAVRADPARFDLVITDQTMPVMTGVTLATELRQLRPDLPIILCTGFSHLINGEGAEALGVDAFVMKPVVMPELVTTIQRVLGPHDDLG